MRKILLIGLMIVAVLSPVFAMPVVWSGIDCAATGNSDFSTGPNWVGNMAPIPYADTVIMNSPTTIPLCFNNAFDDIAVATTGGSNWNGVIVDPLADKDFTMYRSIPQLCPDGSSYDFCFGVDGIYIDNPAGFGVVNSFGIVTGKTYSFGNMDFINGQFDVNANNGYTFVTPAEIRIGDGFFSGAYGGCSNHHNLVPANEGRLNAGIGITVAGIDFLDCVYDSPLTNIDTGPSHGFYQVSLPTNQNMELRNGDTFWTSGNNIPGDYELEAMNSGTSFEMTNASLMPAVGNPAGTIKFKNNQTFAYNNSEAWFTTHWTDSGGTTTLTSTTLHIDQLFWDQSGLITVDAASLLLFDDAQADGAGFGYDPGSTYSMVALTATSAAPNEFVMYPTDLTSSWSTPTQDLYLTNMTLVNNQAGSFEFQDTYLNKTAGLGKVSDYLPGNYHGRNFYIDSNATARMYISGNIAGENYTNLDKITLGTISGDFNYTTVNYTDLPTLNVIGNKNLNAGGTPHIVRSLDVPIEGSTVIQGTRTFEWSREWGVDGYECQVSDDDFATTAMTWSTVGETNNTNAVNLGSLTPETDYKWRCRTNKVDAATTTQYSDWSTPANFFYLYSFSNVCFTGAADLDIISSFTIPTGDTPVNRTLFSKSQTPLSFATFNISSIQLILTYNDSTFNVTDTLAVAPFQNSVATLVVNEFTYLSPMDDTTYNATVVGYLSNGSTCNNTYEYAVADIDMTNSNEQQSAIIWLIEIILILIAIAFFVLAIKSKGSVILEPGSPQR